MKRVINLTTISMFILLSLIAQTVHGVTVTQTNSGVTVQGVKGGTAVSTTITTLNGNDIWATAVDGWIFQTATASPSAFKNTSCSVFGAGTSTSMGTFNFLNFTVAMRGRITASGSGSGPDTYSISATRLSTYYWITAANDKTIVPLGGTETYNAYETMSNSLVGAKNSDWKYALFGSSPQTATSGTSFAMPTTGITAGVYTITGSPVMWAETTSASKNLTIVEVKKIVASSSSASKDIESTKSPSELTNNERLLTIAGEAVAIIATPNPGSAWPEDEPTWGTAYQYNGLPACGFYASVGEHTMGATCGSSSKVITILAFAASISKSTYSDKLRCIYRLSPASVAGFNYEFSIGGVSKNGTVDTQLDADTTPLIISSLLATVGTGSINFKLIDPVTAVKANSPNQYSVREREIYKEGGSYSGLTGDESGTGGPGPTFFSFMIKAKSKYRNILFFSDLSNPVLSSYWATSFSKELCPSDTATSVLVTNGALDLDDLVNVSQEFTPGTSNSGYIMNSGPLDSVFTIAYYFGIIPNTGTVRLELDDDKPEMQGTIPEQ